MGVFAFFTREGEQYLPTRIAMSSWSPTQVSGPAMRNVPVPVIVPPAIVFAPVAVTVAPSGPVTVPPDIVTPPSHVAPSASA